MEKMINLKAGDKVKKCTGGKFPAILSNRVYEVYCIEDGVVWIAVLHRLVPVKEEDMSLFEKVEAMIEDSVAMSYVWRDIKTAL